MQNTSTWRIMGRAILIALPFVIVTAILGLGTAMTGVLIGIPAFFVSVWIEVKKYPDRQADVAQRGDERGRL